MSELDKYLGLTVTGCSDTPFERSLTFDDGSCVIFYKTGELREQPPPPLKLTWRERIRGIVGSPRRRT